MKTKAHDLQEVNTALRVLLKQREEDKAELEKKVSLKPVRIKYSREEEFSVGRRRHPIKLILKTGLKKDGTINVMHVKAVLDTGAYNSFGAKEAGEGPIAPVAGAIANAVYNAVGVRIKELPITPEKILKALEQKRRMPATPFTVAIRPQH